MKGPTGVAPDHRCSPTARTRIDLHLHSRASTDTGNWFLKRAVLPESFTEPEDAYRTAKRRGMDLVTLTDHNTLSGALEIAHHPDVFVSVEVTTRFPEDGTPLHVLVWDITEAQWASLDRIRDSVYEVADFLCNLGLAHALAHPLQRLGAELTPDHIERCILMFPVWEGVNGARPEEGNEAARRIASAVSAEYLAKLADKHGLAPRGSGPPSFTGGSDDHSLLGVACAWTETPPSTSVAEVMGHIRAGRTTACGAGGGTAALAHAMVSLGVTSHVRSGGQAIPNQLRGFLGGVLGQELPVGDVAGTGPLADAGQQMMRSILRDRALVRRHRALSAQPESAQRSHDVLSHIGQWAHGQLVAMALGRGAPSSFSQRIGFLLGAGAIAGPYLGAATYQAGERRFARQMSESFFASPLIEPTLPRVAMFTDTYDELNGVAGTMRRLTAHAATSTDLAELWVMACGTEARGERLVTFSPVTHLPVPAYGDAEWKLGIPSVLDVLAAIEARGIDVIHAATPGPMGLVALLVAKLLQIPFVASHHTELARYAMALTGDRLALELVDAGVGWFYSQARRVYVPSRSASTGVLSYGVPPERIVRFDRGIDTKLFTPERRGTIARRRIGGSGRTVVALYTGRLSREKGVLDLADAFRRASADRPDLRLAIVGDGPDREELRRRLAGTRHTFTGPLRGEALAAAYASADLFCMPSRTETFGQVILEAMSSGLPVVVTDRGASRELVKDGTTGIVARTSQSGEDLANALARLAADAELRQRIGAQARQAALVRPGWTEIFDDLLGGYRDLGEPERVRAEVTSEAPAR